MQSLRSLQRQVAADIFASVDMAAGPYALPNGLTSTQRVRIYRNNVFASLTEALRACYPAVERLVGKEFFSFAAEVYVKRYPAHSGNLHDFGGHFSEFLRGVPALAALPYLPGVAHLEWARQEVYHAEESAPLDIARLARVPDSAYGELKLHLNAASRLLRSNYPILHIWQVNQPDYEGDQNVDLAEGGVRFLVVRRDYAIEIDPLGDGEYVFLRALAKGRTLSHACDLALAEETTFDLAVTLRKHVTQRTLVAFSIHKPTLND